ncbi:MAG: hypothetical protein QXI60_04570 [Thermofilaceae archaeon]
MRKYTRIVEYFQQLEAQRYDREKDEQWTLNFADMYIKLGEPIQALELIRESSLNSADVFIKKRILQARALWSMRMTEAAAYLLFKTIQSQDDYDLCLELARINFLLAVNARNPQQFKGNMEASASTLKHCIRLNPNRPDAYVLHAHLAAPYNEWGELSDRYYNHFEAIISQSTRDWTVEPHLLYDAFATNWLRGRTEKARLWLERLQHCLEESPWLGDRMVFQQLGTALRDMGKSNLYEEYLQVVFLLYPSKAGELVKFYKAHFKFTRLFPIFRLGLRYTDLREYRWRFMFSKARGTEKKNILLALIGEAL